MRTCAWLVFLCVIVSENHVASKTKTLPNPFLDAILKHKLEMDSGYVPVRTGVNIFWWLFYADGRKSGSDGKPVIVWVQGGPGLPASGVGNFMEIGPLDAQFKKRNHSWVYGHNLLLIDSPAGTGFSRVSNASFMATKDKRVVTDFVNSIHGFLKAHPELARPDWHVFSQSYGGKLAPKIGYRIHKAMKSGRLKIKLKTVGIGSGFVDPVESISTSADYMYHMGLIDYADYDKFKRSTYSIVDYIRANKYAEAFIENTQKFKEIPFIMDINKNNVNVDNDMRWYFQIEDMVNNYVKPVLKATRNIKVNWECLSSSVYVSLSANMMLSSRRYVEKLLNETSIKVVVYNGNFDAVTPMAGCVNWVHKLRWEGAQQFMSAQRQVIPGKRTGYYKSWKNLSLWWVLSSGHWVPNDNPAAMKEILKFVTEK